MFLSYIFAILVPKGRKLCYNISDYVKKEATPMKYRKTARPIAFVLAAMLAIPPVSASAITFADISQVPWPGAEVSINKAAELKLVVGETINGKNYFKPKDPVSLTQTCQLAYKLLLETGKATADSSVQEKWSIVMNTYKIQSWAHPAVSFCLEKGIVSISDLSGFVSGEVNRSATREQAAEILGRALEVGVPSKTANATSTIFKDNASISKDAIPYIALLNAEKIVNGDDVGKFNPKNTLNRTETAVMVTNLYKVLNETSSTPAQPEVTKPTSASGEIQEMNIRYVNFKNSSAYYLFASDNISVTLNGDESSITEIVDLFKAGSAMSASLTLNSDTRVTKMTVTSDSAESKEEKDLEGKITKFRYDDDDDDAQITLNSNSTWSVDGDYVLIEIDDEDLDLDELYELFKETKDENKVINIEISLDTRDKVRKIVGEVKRANTSSDEVEGDITDVYYNDDDEDGYVELDDDDRYDFDEDTDFEIDGDDADAEELYELFDDGEDLEAVITLDEDDDDRAEKIEVFTEDYEEEDNDDDEDEVTGEIEGMTYDEDKDEYQGEIKIDGETYECEDTDKIDIEVTNGKKKITSWEDLLHAYKCGMEMDITATVDKDEVTAIEGEVTKVKGILTGYGDDYLKLEFKTKINKETVKKTYSYTFTTYDRDEDDEDELEKWEKAAEKVKIKGLNNVSNMLDFFEVWLDDKPDFDEDVFTMTMTLDSKGMIKSIDADLD